MPTISTGQISGGNFIPLLAAKQLGLTRPNSHSSIGQGFDALYVD
jgi:hypothetical protein